MYKRQAYWYYRLVHLYGDVPFLNIEHTAPKIDFYTHSRKTILAKIEEDLAWAVKWLPKTVVTGAVSKADVYKRQPQLSNKIKHPTYNIKEHKRIVK